MRIALIGYGKMGKEIEGAALARGWTIPMRVDIDTPNPSDDAIRSVDAAIHFASAADLISSITPWARHRIPLVIGTTGWQKNFDAVCALIREHDSALLHSSNFSLGVNIFDSLVREAGKAFDRFPEYDAFIHEIHHKDKVDSPSGTALALAASLMQNLKRKREILSTQPDEKIRPDQLHISSSRAGSVVGTHSVVFDSTADAIELTHRAKNRTGFALGALAAAEWIQKKRGIFTMHDVMRVLFAPRKE
jgi:4-hydroxy-tetrahydrodipicolinate reductase